jgi:hypothetical protein
MRRCNCCVEEVITGPGKGAFLFYRPSPTAPAPQIDADFTIRMLRVAFLRQMSQISQRGSCLSTRLYGYDQ